jgi:hypothetical protein
MRDLIKSVIGDKNVLVLSQWRKRLKNPKVLSDIIMKLTEDCSLESIATYYGTDKVNKDHTFKSKNYVQIYELYLKPKRYKPVVFLEIGVKEGFSLQTWKAYFKYGQIKGIDIDPRCKAFEKNGIEINIGS